MSSSIKRLAGGALVMIAAAGAIGWGLARLSVPASLDAAGLTGRVWSQSESDMARRVTANELAALAAQLDNASRLGDMAALQPVAMGVTQVFRAWSDQPQPVAQDGRYCVLAATHVSRGIDAVAGGGNWRRDQFDASLDACRP